MELRDISCVFTELEAALGVIKEKFTTLSSRDQELQNVIRRLPSKPTLATLWRGDFTTDIPQEVFDLIDQKIVKSNNFGHQ